MVPGIELLHTYNDWRGDVVVMSIGGVVYAWVGNRRGRRRPGWPMRLIARLNQDPARRKVFIERVTRRGLRCTSAHRAPVSVTEFDQERSALPQEAPLETMDGRRRRRRRRVRRRRNRARRQSRRRVIPRRRRRSRRRAERRQAELQRLQAQRRSRQGRRPLRFAPPTSSSSRAPRKPTTFQPRSSADAWQSPTKPVPRVPTGRSPARAYPQAETTETTTYDSYESQPYVAETYAPETYASTPSATYEAPSGTPDAPATFYDDGSSYDEVSEEASPKSRKGLIALGVAAALAVAASAAG